MVVDGDGVIRRVNAEFARLVARPPETLVHSVKLSSLLSAGGRAYLETHLLPVLAHDGSVREVSLDLVRPDRSRVPVLVNAEAGPSGPAQRLRLAFFETRERHRYEQDLLEATRTAQRARAEAAALAQTLQQTLIPPAPPVIPRLSIAATYRPAGDGSVVGGDFYDVFQLDPSSWVVALGDVSGKGISAAVVTSFVRYNIRALAVTHPDPVDLLHALDERLAAHGSDHYLTLALACLLDTGERWTVRLALAGHPPPLLRSKDGSVREVGVYGSPVGLVVAPTFSTVELDLRDEVLVLYTDGVTEARGPRAVYGEDQLHALVGSAPHDAHAITESIAETVLSFQHADASDDIAIISISGVESSHGVQ